MVDSSDFGEAVHELALRLLAGRYLASSLDFEQIALLPGELAPGLPVDIPLPKGATVVGSLVLPDETTVLIDVPGEGERVHDYYRARFEALGWHVEPFGAWHGGFPAVEPPGRGRTFLSRDDGEPSVTMGMIPRGVQSSEVAFEVDRERPPRRRAPRLSDGSSLTVLPTLLPPPGDAQHGGSGGVSGGRAYSIGALESDKPLTTVAEHYRSQMEAKGWQRQDWRLDKATAWSTWRAFDSADTDREALLVAVQPDNNRPDYTMYLETGPRHVPTRDVASGGSSWSFFGFHHVGGDAAPHDGLIGGSESERTRDAWVTNHDPFTYAALRFLAHGFGTPADPQALVPGALPSGLPFVLPVPPGARVVGSLVGRPHSRVIIDTPMNTVQVREFYRSQFKALHFACWSPEDIHANGREVPRSAHFHLRCWSRRQQVGISVSGTRNAGGSTSLLIHIAIGPAAAAFQDVPHAPPAGLSGMLGEWWRERHVHFRPPRGGTLTMLGSGWSAGRMHWRARLTTSSELRSITAHYDRRIRRKRWHRVREEQSGPVGWSTWSRSTRQGQQHLFWLATHLPGTPEVYSLYWQTTFEVDSFGVTSTVPAGLRRRRLQ